MGFWGWVCDRVALVYAKWVQGARGEGRGQRSERRRGRLGAFGQAGLPGVAWCGRIVGCCWVPTGDAGMTGWGRGEGRGVRSERRRGRLGGFGVGGCWGCGSTGSPGTQGAVGWLGGGGSHWFGGLGTGFEKLRAGSSAGSGQVLRGRPDDGDVSTLFCARRRRWVEPARRRWWGRVSGAIGQAAASGRCRLAKKPSMTPWRRDMRSVRA